MTQLHAEPRSGWTPPQPPRKSRPGVVVAVGVMVAVAAVAGVALLTAGGDPASEEPLGVATTLAPAPSTTVDPQATTKANILAAYRQSFDAFIAVGSDPNGRTDDPRLEQHMVGNALLAAQISIQRLRDAGDIYEGTVEVHPSVVELTEDTAVVQDCGFDRLSVVDVETGEVVVPQGPAEANLATATYRLIDGVWMQNTFTDQQRTCVPPES